MRKSSIVVATLIVVTVFFSFKLFWNTKDKDSPTPVNQSNGPSLYKEETSAEGNVTVAVTPVSLASGSKTWDFQISLDTHSAPLDQDMTKTSTIVDDSGRVYEPIQWDGDPAGGHHRQGVLKFKPIIPAPQTVTLKIEGIGVPVRTFTWSLLK